MSQFKEIAMKCSKVKKLLSPYIDNELTGAQKELLDAHIKACTGCSKELETLQGLHTTFVAMQNITAPYGFATRVMAALEENKVKMPSFFPVFTRLAEAVLIIAIIIIGTRAGSFLGSMFMEQKTTLVSSLSLDSFEPVQPGSIAGAYTAMIEGTNEK